ASEKEEPEPDWPDKHQSCMVLVKKGLCSFEEDSPELLALEKMCRKTDLFYRGSVAMLGSFYRQMETPKQLHEYQIAPRASVWPRNYCTSWELSFLDILKAIIGKTPVTLDQHLGLVASLPLREQCVRRDWKQVAEAILDTGFRWVGKKRTVKAPENPVVQFTNIFAFSELDQKIFRLIHAGIFPFTQMDFSEIATGQRAVWSEEESSPYCIPLFHLACQFGSEEIVRKLLQVDNALSLHQYYKTHKDSYTPYVRALMNETCPSVLIPLLEEAEKNPQGHLAQEIANFVPEEGGGCIFPAVSWLFEKSSWWMFSQNALLRACVSGDVSWARYVVRKKEEETMRASVYDSDQKRWMAAAIAVASYVNTPGVLGAPSGTPVEIAIRFERWEVVRFLCSKGAKATLEAGIQATQHVTEQMFDVIGKWHRVGKEINEVIEQMDSKPMDDRLSELIAVRIAYEGFVLKEQQETRRNALVADEIDAVISRLKILVNLLKNSSKDVVNYDLQHSFRVFVPVQELA
ncbi:MAG: hypothetical protein K2X08_07860, partial [Chlamydiales bacterium]|nr:hypothetical protein [Chlamydiales bacterium]